jgi:hypothetical protein
MATIRSACWIWRRWRSGLRSPSALVRSALRSGAPARMGRVVGGTTAPSRTARPSSRTRANTVPSAMRTARVRGRVWITGGLCGSYRLLRRHHMRIGFRR